MKGYFTIKVSNNDEERVVLKFQNMILKSGLDYILNNTSVNKSTSLINTCILSNGTTPPKFNDAGMSGDIVGKLGISGQNVSYTDPSGSTSDNFENTLLVHQHIFKTKATTFATISEIATAIVGVDNTTTLFSKTLLKDESGNPAQFSVAPGDDIEIRYTIVAARNKEVTCNVSRSTVAIPNSDYWYSPLVGLRTELSTWSISTYSESVSKAGCTWSIDFDTTNVNTDKSFDIIFNLEYAEGSTAYGSFVSATVGATFDFYYKFFNTSYRVRVPHRQAEELVNGRKIKIKQKFKLIDINTIYGTSIYEPNSNLSLTGVATDLTKGGLFLNPNNYDYDVYGKLMYKRFIKPFTPYPFLNIDHLLLCNNYIYVPTNWDPIYYSGASFLSYLNSLSKLKVDQTVMSSEADKSRIYLNSGKLGAVISGTNERLDAFVNRISISTVEQTSGEKRWYTALIQVGVYGNQSWVGAETVASGIKIYVNDKELIYNEYKSPTYYGGWFYSVDGQQMNSEYTNTLPLDGSEVIRIVGNGYDLTFQNTPYKYDVFNGRYMTALADSIKATVTLHTNFYGEDNE